MLFMTVFTYEPAQRNEVIQRRAEKGALAPKNMKVIGEWSYAGAGRVFRLVDTEDRPNEGPACQPKRRPAFAKAMAGNLRHKTARRLEGAPRSGAPERTRAGVGPREQ